MASTQWYPDNQCFFCVCLLAAFAAGVNRISRNGVWECAESLLLDGSGDKLSSSLVELMTCWWLRRRFTTCWWLCWHFYIYQLVYWHALTDWWLCWNFLTRWWLLRRHVMRACILICDIARSKSTTGKSTVIKRKNSAFFKFTFTVRYSHGFASTGANVLSNNSFVSALFGRSLQKLRTLTSR